MCIYQKTENTKHADADGRHFVFEPEQRDRALVTTEKLPAFPLSLIFAFLQSVSMTSTPLLNGIGNIP